MPSYAPPKPPPKRPPRPQKFNPEWLERRDKSLKLVTQLLAIQTEELNQKYLLEAEAHLHLLDKVNKNKTYADTFYKVQRLVLLGLGLTRER